MLPLTTTLTAIRAERPCEEGWATLLSHLGKTRADADPLPLTVILDSNGLDDTLWVLDKTTGLRRICVLFAADCAEQVLPLFERDRPDDSRPRRAIEVARDPHASAAAWFARDAAIDAASAAAWAASDAAWAARAAARAARAAAWDAWDAASAAASDAASAAAWAASDASAAAWDAAWDAASAAAIARLRQYLIHGEAASALPWEPQLIRETML